MMTVEAFEQTLTDAAPAGTRQPGPAGAVVGRKGQLGPGHIAVPSREREIPAATWCTPTCTGTKATPRMPAIGTSALGNRFRQSRSRRNGKRSPPSCSHAANAKPILPTPAADPARKRLRVRQGAREPILTRWRTRARPPARSSRAARPPRCRAARGRADAPPGRNARGSQPPRTAPAGRAIRAATSSGADTRRRPARARATRVLRPQGASRPLTGSGQRIRPIRSD